MGRWFAIDPALQAASPYMAMGNNPMMMVDEDGEFAVLTALAVGALIGAGSYTASIAFSKGGFDNWNWGGFFQSAGMGAVSGVATGGIGEIFGSLGGAATNSAGTQMLNETGRALAHGVAQGGLGAVQGDNFFNGFASGAISSIASSGFQSLDTKFTNSKWGGTSFGALSGGVGAELSGGNFWRGAGVGATVSLLNHYAHDGLEKWEEELNRKRRAAEYAQKAFKGISLSNKKTVSLNSIADGFLDYGASTIDGLSYTITGIGAALRGGFTDMYYDFKENGKWAGYGHPHSGMYQKRYAYGFTREKGFVREEIDRYGVSWGNGKRLMNGTLGIILLPVEFSVTSYKAIDFVIDQAITNMISFTVGKGLDSIPNE